MPIYFIETIIDANRSSDAIGTIFHDGEDAIKVALWALLDIVNDETESRTELDVTIVVKDACGASIFSATLQAERRLHSEIRVGSPMRAEVTTPKFHPSP